MITLKPGVWHHAPFVVQEGAIVNVQILLPRRTYRNDCVVRHHSEPIPFVWP